MKTKNAKFKKKLVNHIRTEKQEIQEQTKLKDKYHVTDKDVIVVEKTGLVKFLIRTLTGGIKVLATAVFFLLSIIGLAALIYPGARQELIRQGLQVYGELKTFLPF